MLSSAYRILNGNGQEVDSASIPTSLITGSTKPRLRVDVGEAGFFEGRQFRAYYDISLGAGASLVIKFTSPSNFILESQNLSVTTDQLMLQVMTGGTPGGVFGTVVPVIGKNRMTEVPTPVYVSGVSITTGGTITGGTEVDKLRVSAIGTGANQGTVGTQVGDSRGLPAGTFYLKFTNYGNGTAIGLYSLWWEERI